MPSSDFLIHSQTSQSRFLTVFLPVYNSSDKLLVFINHFKDFIGGDFNINFCVLNCGSPIEFDLSSISDQSTNISIVNLDPSFFWGSCINYSLEYYRNHYLGTHFSIFNIDTHHFLDKSISSLPRMLNKSGILVPKVFYVDQTYDDFKSSNPTFCFKSHKLSTGDILHCQSFTHFCPKSGRFTQSVDQQVNITSTVGLIISSNNSFLLRYTKLDAFFAPHYLSDFIFTRRLFLSGLPLTPTDEWAIVRFKNEIKAPTTYSFSNKKSVHYIPALLYFFASFSSPYAFIRICIKIFYKLFSRL